jgi:hypothetical protein
VAGFLEPCGCVKDQLGGLDRFATAVQQISTATPSLLVTTGALFFPRAELDPSERTELSYRAETLAKILRAYHAFAWTPTRADSALGMETQARLIELSGMHPLPAFVPRPPPVGVDDAKSHVHDSFAKSDCTVTSLGSVRVGVCGISAGSARPGALDVVTRLQSQARQLSTDGAELKIVLLDTDTRTALRAADKVSDFHLFVVSGAPNDAIGADNDGAEPLRVGPTLIVQPPNHLRGIVTVEFDVRDSKFVFEDATGVGRAAEKKRLGERISELRERLTAWQRQDQDAAMLRARQQDLDHLLAQQAELSKPVATPSTSYFTVHTTEIGSRLTGNVLVRKTLDALGRRINDNNREKFADRKAPPLAPGQPGFVGVGECEKCHESAAAFWRTTRHSRAYQSLVRVEREFTLDCVGCHVTGYEIPGGSTVTDVAGLKNVQCENCHGAGSLHSATRLAQDIQRRPKRELCAQRCHHSPHVATTWTVDDAWPHVLGPGHGEPSTKPNRDRTTTPAQRPAP